MASFWDKEEVVAEVNKSDKGKYIITKAEKSGKQYIGIREWYCTQNDPTWKPGKNGMNLPMTVAKEVLEALLKEVR